MHVITCSSCSSVIDVGRLLNHSVSSVCVFLKSSNSCSKSDSSDSKALKYKIYKYSSINYNFQIYLHYSSNNLK